MAHRVAELGEEATQFQNDEAVDAAPELGGDDLGVLVATDAAAAHKASARLDNMGKGGLERL